MSNSKNNLLKSPIYIQKNNWVIKELKNTSGNILDIGIGYGYLEELIIKHKLQLYLYGIDISNRAVDLARRKYKGIFKVANIRKIPFRRNHFNCVIALDVLEHIFENELSNALLEVKRVLKKDGKLIISVPLNENEIDKKTNKHLISFSKKSMINTLERNGFKINETRELFAFQRLYLFKSIISNLINIKKPNLLIIKATKE